mmetsp:Transcript_926/g.2173  ORF Transcript_926/g.2173 Transcript_926/m.2173 type:complete len:1220 (-) Transcript_926:1097-4756(-)
MAEIVGSESGIEEKILMSNPILEAFGNATTLRNDNSSRFGKWVEMIFDTHGRIKGARVHNYMLEKSRVTVQNEGERNFHVFYLLCRQAHEFPQLGLTHDIGYWKCLRGAFTPSDEDRLSQLATAIRSLNISDERVLEVYKIVAAILHLGNLEVLASGDASYINPNEHLDWACSLLQISSDDLSMSICSKKLVSGRETILKFMTLEQAVENLANLSKSLYSALFDFIVRTSNKEQYKDDLTTKESPYIVGVLDMYGFEVLPQNSFEQFCINYANEKLHQHFVFCTFKKEMQTYQQEGISYEKIGFIDNLQVLELIENPRHSLMSMLNDEVLLPRGSDESVLSRMNRDFANHPNYAKDFRTPTKFTVKHFAGEVAYDIRGFLSKNADKVSADLIELAKTSQNLLFRELLGSDALASKKPILFQFKQQLDSMMESIRQTNSHFIRCIKPNNSKMPDLFQDPIVLDQLKFSGIFETAKILQQGFTNQMSHQEFVFRYSCLSTGLTAPSPKQHCEALIRKISSPALYQVGETTVFFGNKAYYDLERRRNEVVSSLIIHTQSSFKRRIAMKLKQQLLAAKPEFIAALRSKDLAIVQATLDKYDHLSFEIKEMRDLKALRRNLSDQQTVEELLAALDLSRPQTCRAKIMHALSLADSINYTSPTVEYARQQVSKAHQLSLVLTMFEARSESDMTIEEIEILIKQFREFGLEDDDDHLLRLLMMRDIYYRERDMMAQLRSAMENGGPSSVNDDFTTLQTKQLHFKLVEAESLLPGRDKKLAELHAAGEVLLKIRNCLKRHDWEGLQLIMLHDVDRHPILESYNDLWVACQALLKHSTNSSLEQELKDAIKDKNLQKLQMLVSNIEANSISVSRDIYTQAKAMLQKLQQISGVLKEAMRTKQIDQLNAVINACIELDFSNMEVLNAIQMRDQLESIYKEAALALNIMDVKLMQSIMKLSRELGLKNTSEQNDIHHILFEMDELAIKTLQVECAEGLRDDYLLVERRIALVDEKIKSTFFRSDWKMYPSLKDPKVWASSLLLPGKKHHTFHTYTRHIIHESLSHVGSSKNNKAAVKCFRSIMTVMGDRIAGPPGFEANYLVKTARKVPQIQEEIYLQLMKQLTSNPDSSSRRKGWNLLALFLRTFPTGNLLECIHAFIRKSCDVSESLLRLMYYSVGRFPRDITQEYIDRNLNARWEVPLVQVRYSIDSHPELTVYRPKYKKQSTLSFT